MVVITTLIEQDTHSSLYEDYDDETQTRVFRRVYVAGHSPEERRQALELKLKATTIELRARNAAWDSMTDAQKLRSIRDLYKGYVNLIQYVLFSMDDDAGI